MTCWGLLQGRNAFKRFKNINLIQNKNFFRDDEIVMPYGRVYSVLNDISCRQQQAECPLITAALSNQACLMRRVIGSLPPRARDPIQPCDWLWQRHNRDLESRPNPRPPSFSTLHTTSVYIHLSALLMLAYTRAYGYMPFNSVFIILNCV